jgi:hypothetical protein
MNSQLELDLQTTENMASDVGGQNRREAEWVSGDELDRLLAMAPRTPGWNMRDRWPPAFVTIDGNHGHGCALAVVPAVHWRSQRCWRERPACPQVVRFPSRRAAA